MQTENVQDETRAGTVLTMCNERLRMPCGVATVLFIRNLRLHLWKETTLDIERALGALISQHTAAAPAPSV